MNARYTEFDIMKGIGILLMIIGHLTPYLTNVIFSFHMPMFFIISGYFFKPTPISSRIKYDLRRLIIPYIFTCTIIIAFYLVLSISQQKDLMSNIITAALYGSGTTQPSIFFSDIPMIGAIWFLPAMFWCRNAYNILFQKSKHTLITSFVISILAILLHRLISLPMAINQGLTALLFYAIGVKAREIGAPGSIKKTYSCLLICAWVLAFTTSSLSMVKCTYKFLPLDILGAIGGTIVVYYISLFIKNIKPVSSILTYIGINSLTFLCIHLIDLDAPTSWIFGIGQEYKIFYDLAFCIIVVFLFSKIRITRDIYGIKQPRQIWNSH